MYEFNLFDLGGKFIAGGVVSLGTLKTIIHDELGQESMESFDRQLSEGITAKYIPLAIHGGFIKFSEI